MVNGERISEIKITREGLSHTPVRLSSNREVSMPTKYDTNIRIAQFIAGPHLYNDLLDVAINSGYSAIIIHGTGLGHLQSRTQMVTPLKMKNSTTRSNLHQFQS